jgi:hypothetical protein
MDQEVEGFLGRMTAAVGAFEARRPAVEARAPWTLSDVFGAEPEASWGPPELTAHVAEMLPFWLGEIERVLGGAPEPVPFGRVSTDALRIGVIGRDRSLPIPELFARVVAGAGRYERRLPELSAGDLARRGIHPTLGEITVAGILERFVVGHLEEHVRQLADILEA